MLPSGRQDLCPSGRQTEAHVHLQIGLFQIFLHVCAPALLVSVLQLLDGKHAVRMLWLMSQNEVNHGVRQSSQRNTREGPSWELKKD
jgi:hypothetical protein